MAESARPARLILVALGFALVVVAVSFAPPAWFLLTKERVYLEQTFEMEPSWPIAEMDGAAVRGWYILDRWSGEYDGLGVLFYDDCGARAHETMFRDGKIEYSIFWARDGRVLQELVDTPGDARRSSSLEPMPAWMKDDEKWQAALDAQR